MIIPRRICNKVLALTIFIFTNNLSFAVSDEHNILVLHSYHQGLEWTDNISLGIQEVFKDRTDVNLIFEYLDAKRNFDEAYKKQLYELYRVKSKQIPFELILISDNAAFDFITKHKDEFYPNIPIIYCGVNDLDTIAIKKTTLFYGTGEKADHYGTISAIEKVFPERKNVLIINDNTLTGKKIKNELNNVLKSFNDRLNFEFVSDFTLKSLQDKVMNLDESYTIYLLVINRDKYGNFISYKKGISKLKEVSNVPIFGSWDFYENRGIIGGKITRGKDQGKYIAEIALKIINGAPYSDFPKFVFLESNYVFDYNQMKRFGISKRDLPKGSILINKPNWKNALIYISLILIIALSISLILLAARLKLKRIRMIKMEKIIRQRTSDLKKTNNELTEIITAKNKFFSILAHDLRNSVGAFQSISILLNSDNYEHKSESTTILRENLQIAANQTYGIVEDLLYWGYNQFKNNKNIDISNFNIDEIIINILEKFRLNSSNCTFITDIGTDINISSDKNICDFILRNIIQNAIKYSNEGGTIEIKAEKKNEQICLSIKDYGVGMSQEIIDSIYNKQPIRRQGLKGQKSMGLGLPTVLEYLETINGDLQIISEPEKGTEFLIQLCNL